MSRVISKAELREHVVNISMSGHEGDLVDAELVLDLIDQLDEPEKVIVPQWFAEWYESRGYDMSLYGAFNELYTNHQQKMEKWAEQHEMKHAELQKSLASIFKIGRNGYTVEEKKYHVLDEKGCVLLKKYISGVSLIMTTGIKPERFPEWQQNDLTLTEQEIKGYDERFWPFAKEVTR